MCSYYKKLLAVAELFRLLTKDHFKSLLKCYYYYYYYY